MLYLVFIIRYTEYKIRMAKKICFILVSASLWGAAHFASATDLESTNFRLKDPIIPPAGGYSTSTSFRLTGAVSQISIGTSSASNFRVSSGFLYFPAVTTPTLTVTAGDAQVSLSWTVSSGVLGWTVSGYNAGRATASGGPYTFTSMGSTTSGTITGLTNGTTYYFIVRPEDFFGNSLATSSEVSSTPAASATPPPASPATPAGGNGPIGPIFELINYFIKISPPSYPEGCVPEIPQDLNCDGKVSLQDLSVFLFFSPQPLPNPADFNNDRVVDLQDLSFIFFGWTERPFAFISEEPVRLVRQDVEKGEVSKKELAFIIGAAEDEDGKTSKEGVSVSPKLGVSSRAIERILWIILVMILGFYIWRRVRQKG